MPPSAPASGGSPGSRASAGSRGPAGAGDAAAPGLSLPPQEPHPREAFLVLPGLNLHPHRLDACSALLSAAGAAVLTPRLTGFAAPGDPALGRVRAEGWLADLDTAWAHGRARLPTAQPSLLGFSLGGLLGLVWAQRAGLALRRAVLIAPALRLRPHHRAMIRALGPLLPGGLRLPSRSPAAYRFHPSTSVAAYRSLGRLERMLAAPLARWVSGAAEDLPPLLIVCPAGDELIDTRPLAALSARHPEQVTLLPLKHKPREGYPRHLALDAYTLGDAEWRRFSDTLTGWLARTTPPAAEHGGPAEHGDAGAGTGAP